MRNCVSAFKRISLIFLLFFPGVHLFCQDQEAMISLSEDWEGTIFGDVGGQDKISSENFLISQLSEDAILMHSLNNRGKIASSSEGIAYAYKSLPANQDFELSAKVTIESFSSHNQASFGLMIRDKVYEGVSTKNDLGSYIALGPLDSQKTAPKTMYYRSAGGTVIKAGAFTQTPPPAHGIEYTFRLRKSGNSYALDFDGEETSVIENFQDFKGDNLYWGFFTSRNTEVLFSEIQYKTADASLTGLELDPSTFPVEYLIGQVPDLSQLRLTALKNQGEKQPLSPADYFISGFDSDTAGEKTLTFHYQGQSLSVPVTVKALSLSDVAIVFPPVKTEYYLQDPFDPFGLQVNGIYNDGYKSEELTPEGYSLSINGKDGANYIFSTPGTIPINVQSSQNPEKQTSFDIEVKPSRLKGLQIMQGPNKQQYYEGEEFDPTGLTVHALYSGGGSIRLGNEEYSISGFSSSTPGRKRVNVQFRGEKASFVIKVKEVEPIGIALRRYPRTTLLLGEPFSTEGMELVRTSTDGSEAPLEASAYRIDTSRLDTSQPGTGMVKIFPQDTSLPPLSLPVTVREAPPMEWQTIRFGQSTSEDKNYAEERPDGATRLVALRGGGKVTQDHDGITYYYTKIDGRDNFVLEADIAVQDFAKNPHDGQESFGIMARDAIGPAGDSSLFASNIVGLGGYSGGTRNEMGTSLFLRQGITSSDGAGSKGITVQRLQSRKPDQSNTYPNETYHLRLEKTNSGFKGSLNSEGEVFFWEPDCLNVQEDDIFVGFFTARLATIDIYNMKLTISDGQTDAPKEKPPETALEPVLVVLSQDKTSSEEYNLVGEATVKGTILVKQGYEVLVRDYPVLPAEEFSLPVILEDNTETPFSILFTPDESQFLTSYEPIVVHTLVSSKIYQKGKEIFVSPTGTSRGNGTAASPLDLDTALAYVQPGQSLILSGGRYERTKPLVVSPFNDGREGALKNMVAAEGEIPIIDFKRMSRGAVLSGNYWHIKGIAFTHSAGNTPGCIIGGDCNIIEDCRFYENGDTGLQISRTDSRQDDIEKWPSNNLILNCESFDNADPSQNNADGFAAKITSGRKNVFRGCIAHHNIDDGWDLYTKAGRGEIGSVLIEECIAYENGTLTNGEDGNGDKNGFKLGGEGIAIPHIIRHCLSFGNGADGFTSNSNPAIRLEDCFSFENAGRNLDLETYTGIAPQFQVKGFLSYHTSGGLEDKIPQDLNARENYFFDGHISVNRKGKQLTADGFYTSLSEHPPLKSFLPFLKI